MYLGVFYYFLYNKMSDNSRFKKGLVIAEEMLTEVTDDPDWLKRVTIGEETYINSSDITTKAQLSQWKFSEEQRLKKHVKSSEIWKSY